MVFPLKQPRQGVLQLNFQEGFNPFKELFVAQDRKPDQIHDVDLQMLTPFQRVVLIHDGTVTKLFEVYRAEPIEVEVLSQKIGMLSHDPWLNLTGPTEVVERQVLLIGQCSSLPVTYATSTIVLNRTPDFIQAGLETKGMGLGRMMLDCQMENRRELLWYGREHLQKLPIRVSMVMENELLSRMYRIIVDGQPIMVIHERFPLKMDS